MNISDNMNEQDFFQIITEHAPGGIYLSADDETHTYTYVNQGLARMLDYTYEDFMTVTHGCAAGAVYFADRRNVLCQWRRALERRKEYRCVYRMQKRDGKLIWVRTCGKLWRGASGKNQVIAFIVDITDEMKNRFYLQRLAATDSLTGILNHRAIFEAVIRYFKKSRRCGAVLMLDVDHFKRVNDLMGHYFGDEVLTKIADALICVMPLRSSAGRVGGDEFMVLLRNLSEQQVCERASALLKALEERFVMVELGISCSIGIAYVRHTPADFKKIYNAADKALYEAKRRGRKRWEIQYIEERRE